MRCKLHELCIVEPGEQTAEPAISITSQVAGLLVTTLRARPNEIWEVAPAPLVRVYEMCTDISGRTILPGVYDVYLPDSWLRPLRGDPLDIDLVCIAGEGVL